MPSSRPVCLDCGGRLLYVERVVRTFEVDRVERGCVERGDLVETNEGSPTALGTGRLVCDDCARSWTPTTYVVERAKSRFDHWRR